MAEPVTYYYSKTQRIVLLIDLYPLLRPDNSSSGTAYINTILASAKRLLTFPSLSSSLFAFKLFFSSLSPLRSSSALPDHYSSLTTSLSFDHPSQTLTLLCTTLNSLSRSPISSSSFSGSVPRASHIASSLLQLIHDYAWESEIENQVLGNRTNNLEVFLKIRSNLVILFTPISGSLTSLSEYMNVPANSEFEVKFNEVFRFVNDAFVCRDIHCCWLDIMDELEVNKADAVKLSRTGLALLEKCARNLGWGFFSADSIVFGSAIVPFGLIYPKIGGFINFLEFGDWDNKSRGQLSLEILDVNDKPLECKCCDLEFVKLKRSAVLGGLQSEKVLQEEIFWNAIGDGRMKLHVKAVQRYNEIAKMNGRSFEYIGVVRQFLGKTKNNCILDFYADKVLQLLSEEEEKLDQNDSLPFWQILLSFLHREGYCALVSLSGGNGVSFACLLKPFTSHFALLSVINDDHIKIVDCDTTDLVNIPDDRSDFNELNGSQTEASTSEKCKTLGDGRKRKSKKLPHYEFTWSSFSEAAMDCSDFDLTEIYFSKKFKNPKKLKFLKCWMKQIKKCKKYCLRVSGGSNPSQQPSDPNFLSEPCRLQEGSTSASVSENAELFFNNLPEKIQHGLESGMELQNLAERVVKSSTSWLCRKYEIDSNLAGQTTETNSVNSQAKRAATELIKLLLRDPKAIKEKGKLKESSSNADELSSASDFVVREYELQILLRMEILRSDVSKYMEESVKQKLLNQICALLEIIQFLVGGGIHGHISLYDYVERTIKARYCRVLEDVVDKIYTQMDLVPFGDEDENQILLLNSEDSNHSWREKPEWHEKAETNSNQSVSAEDDFCQLPENVDENWRGVKQTEHARKLSEARERRERARRFGSFTSWVPDLQRVWAPKQPKAVHGKSNALQKETKRKDRQKACYSVVYETPMTGNKRFCSTGNNKGDEQHSVSKALFQDN